MLSEIGQDGRALPLLGADLETDSGYTSRRLPRYTDASFPSRRQDDSPRARSAARVASRCCFPCISSSVR
jgi:hypothetical protein